MPDLRLSLAWFAISVCTKIVNVQIHNNIVMMHNFVRHFFFIRTIKLICKKSVPEFYIKKIFLSTRVARVHEVRFHQFEVREVLSHNYFENYLTSENLSYFNF